MDVSKAFKSRSMKSMLGDHLLRNGLPMFGPSDVSCIQKQHKVGSVISTMNKFVRGKLRLGGNTLQVGRVEKMFRQIFSGKEGEGILKAFQCKLYTTAGPIGGRIFICTEKIAFCSDRPIAKVSTAPGEINRFHYKVVIPLCKIKRANQSEIVKKPSQKYLQVVTNDEFEFWFMGFVNYRKTFSCLQQAIVNAKLS